MSSSPSVEGQQLPFESATQQSPLLSGDASSAAQRANTNHTTYHATLRRSLIKYFAIVLVFALLAFTALHEYEPERPRVRSSLRPPATPPSATDSVVFAAIGDWGRHGHYHQATVARAMASVLPAETSAIISVGDNFYEDGVASLLDPQFNHSFEAVYADDRIVTTPWLVALGNHDYHGSVTAQIMYSHVSSRWHLPAPYYTHWLSSNLLAIFLDTTPLSDSSMGEKAREEAPPAQQLAWLEETMSAAPKYARFLIIGHHNMYSMSVADHMGVLSVRDAVEPLLLRYSERVVAYVAGHEHALMHMSPYGVSASRSHMRGFDHFVTGAGSKLRAVHPPPVGRAAYWRQCCGVLAYSANASLPRTVWGKAAHGFFVFRMEGDAFSATVYNDAAQVIYEYQKHFPPLLG